ncbi:hypothetical protein ACO2Q0_21225 [Phenylobacterium sp. VNQ135]|uniref:hypothetical protein n=1 Tax=Phenylobacterium sp. VNQ135 TaxID=3400922 RepID=UPI003C04CC46
MSRVLRTLAAVLAVAAVYAGGRTAQAQPVYLPTLHQSLDVQAANLLASAPATGNQPRQTLGRVLSFRVGRVQFAAAPAVRYSVLPGYAWVVGTCPTDTNSNSTPKLPPASPNEPQSGPPPTLAAQPMSLAGRTAMVGLPPPPQPPVSAFDYSLSVEIDKTTTLSPLLSGYEDALTTAWATAAVSGLGAAPASSPPRPLLNGADAPRLGATSFLVLPVMAYYDLEGAAYSAPVGLGQFTGLTTATGAETMLEAPPSAELTLNVAGQLSGGRWGQGAGLLFIPNPAGAATTRWRPGSSA